MAQITSWTRLWILTGLLLGAPAALAQEFGAEEEFTPPPPPPPGPRSAADPRVHLRQHPLPPRWPTTVLPPPLIHMRATQPRSIPTRPTRTRPTPVKRRPKIRMPPAHHPVLRRQRDRHGLRGLRPPSGPHPQHATGSTGLMRVREAGGGPAGTFRLALQAGMNGMGAFLCNVNTPCPDPITGLPQGTGFVPTLRHSPDPRRHAVSVPGGLRGHAKRGDQ